MNDATRTTDETPAWLNRDQILSARTRTAMERAEALAWELMPRMIELSYVAGNAHAMVHSEWRAAEADVWQVLARFSGYQRMREVLDLIGGFGASAADDSVPAKDQALKLADKYSEPGFPVNVGAVMQTSREAVDDDDWPVLSQSDMSKERET